MAHCIKWKRKRDRDKFKTDYIYITRFYSSRPLKELKVKNLPKDFSFPIRNEKDRL